MIDDTGFPKDGKASPCVARQYSGTLGKIGNCQIGVSVHLVTDTASLAANWRLFCPSLGRHHDHRPGPAPSRSVGAEHEPAIPDEVRHREKWRLALDMLDEMTSERSWGHCRSCPVVADCRLRRQPPSSGSA